MVTKRLERIRTDGKSWVIRLPKKFAEQNNLAAGTQVLLTVKNGSVVEAEVVPPLSDELMSIAKKIMKKRKGVYDRLKEIGD